MVAGVKERDVPVRSLLPIMIGPPVLIIGNLISILPGNFFTLRRAARHYLRRSLMFYAMYREADFRMTLQLSRGVVLAETMCLCSVMGAYLIRPTGRSCRLIFRNLRLHDINYSNLFAVSMMLICPAPAKI